MWSFIGASFGEELLSCALNQEDNQKVPTASFTADDLEPRAHHSASEQRDDEPDGHDEIHLESIEDLDHLSYLSLRNYNLTEEGLLQSSRLMSLGSALGSHKLHQLDEAAAVQSLAGDKKLTLPLMLESFILHLKNGHLKRMALEDLETASNLLNLTESFASLRQRRLDTLGGARNRTASRPSQRDGDPASAMAPEPLDEDEIRCIRLVTLYKFDLGERLKKEQPQSKVEYENGAPQANGIFQSSSAAAAAAAAAAKSGSSDFKQQQHASALSSQATTISTGLYQSRDGAPSVDLDQIRLVRLCKLVITCRSADELVSLISKPWKESRRTAIGAKAAPGDDSQLERDTSQGAPAGVGLPPPPPPIHSSSQLGEPMMSGGNAAVDHETRARRKSLRDSLSLSLAKLCPLILFPLHEEDGQCSLRRDDRPPTITVWAFATLFVTIVCFCSLIGLLITPFLGESTPDSSLGSDTSEPPPLGANEPVHRRRRRPSLNGAGPIHSNDLNNATTSTRQQMLEKKHQHRASLTLFEGLAVGSLVGSALFSLIPQAFELQERESNHSFLLKAFIIFSGIYLFFCSERIMRIILDTRQMRKKKKRQTLHRSSTTAAMEGLVGDSHQHPRGNQAFAAAAAPTSSSSRMLSSPQVPSSHTIISARASGGKRRAASKRRNATGVGSELAPIDVGRRLNLSKSQRQDTTLGGANRSLEQQVAARLRVGKKKQMARNRSARPGHRSGVVSQHQLQQYNRVKTNAGLQQLHHPNKRQRRQKQARGDEGTRNGRQIRLKKQPATRLVESDLDGCYYHTTQMSSTSSSASTSCSTSSFFSHTRNRLRTTQKGLIARLHLTGDSPVEYSFSSSTLSQSDLSACSSCASFDFHTDSDEDNNQARAVSKQMSEFTKRFIEQQQQQQQQSHSLNAHPGASDSTRHQPTISPSARNLKTTFKSIEDDQERQAMWVARQRAQSRWTPQSYDRGQHHPGRRANKQEISTVAWMIVLGDGLHNFIDGISIGAAFSESILSGVSISVAVLCEEIPHELGDFAVLVSAGMTVRQALGYNFLSACTCYLGMAVGIILGDVTDGASYISALAAGVFLYIALVDMMGELSAALEESSRYSITKTLKLLLLQNVGIFIGISIIFVLSFIDF